AGEHGRAFLRRGLAPHPEALRSDLERPVEVGRLGQRQRADRLPGDRIDHIERAAASARDLLAIDDHVKRWVFSQMGLLAKWAGETIRKCPDNAIRTSRKDTRLSRFVCIAYDCGGARAKSTGRWRVSGPSPPGARLPRDRA